MKTLIAWAGALQQDIDMVNGPIKKYKDANKLNKALQEIKNEQHRAARDYDYAEPRTGKETAAKLRYRQATKIRKRIEKKLKK